MKFDPRKQYRKILKNNDKKYKQIDKDVEDQLEHEEKVRKYVESLAGYDRALINEAKNKLIEKWSTQKNPTCESELVKLSDDTIVFLFLDDERFYSDKIENNVFYLDEYLYKKFKKQSIKEYKDLQKRMLELYSEDN